jgi:hypothetical protein
MQRGRTCADGPVYALLKRAGRAVCVTSCEASLSQPHNNCGGSLFLRCVSGAAHCPALSGSHQIVTPCVRLLAQRSHNGRQRASRQRGAAPYPLLSISETASGVGKTPAASLEHYVLRTFTDHSACGWLDWPAPAEAKTCGCSRVRTVRRSLPRRCPWATPANSWRTRR